MKINGLWGLLEDFAKWLLESFQINNKTLMIAPVDYDNKNEKIVVKVLKNKKIKK